MERFLDHETPVCSHLNSSWPHSFWYLPTSSQASQCPFPVSHLMHPYLLSMFFLHLCADRNWVLGIFLFLLGLSNFLPNYCLSIPFQEF